MCDEDVDDTSKYNYALQGAGLVIVASASALGAGFSYWIAHAKRHGGKELVFVAKLLSLLKGMGTGVAISTALIHLIGEAYDGFEAAGWSCIYDSWPMVFALIGIFLIAFSEFMARRMHAESGTHQSDNQKAGTSDTRRTDPEALLDVDHGHGHVPKHDVPEAAPSPSPSKDTDSFISSKEITSKRTAAAMMELSVVTHSVIVGLDLGLRNESAWSTFVVAVLFHQFFEGIALAQVVAEARYESLLRAMLALGAFVLTTPLGIAIGMIVRATTGVNSTPTGVDLLLAILNSLCGGFLLYVGMVNLLSSWFVQDANFLRATAPYAVLGWVGLAMGMAAMAIIGIWA